MNNRKILATIIGAISVILYLFIVTIRPDLVSLGGVCLALAYFSGMMIGYEIAYDKVQDEIPNLRAAIKSIMSDKCIVCKKTIRKGDRAGFSPLHANECADKWNSWPEQKRREILEAIKNDSR